MQCYCKFFLRLAGALLGLLGQRHAFAPGDLLDMIHVSETEGAPVFVDGHLPHGLQVVLPQYGPPCIAVEIAGIALGCAFGVAKPKDGISFQLGRELLDDALDFRLLGHESDGKRDAFSLPAVGQDLRLGRHLVELCLKARGVINGKDAWLTLEVEFFEKCVHRFTIYMRYRFWFR